MALRLIGPAVPNEIRLLTGPEGSTFHEYGLQYKEYLARHGVTVKLETTATKGLSIDFSVTPVA